MLKYCLDKFKSQEMGKGVLPKFVPDWFVMNSMLKDLDNGVFFNDDIVFPNADPDVTFFIDDVGSC